MTAPHLGLGLDAGGTQTRWALADAAGEIVAQGEADGLTALQMGTESGRAHIRETIAAVSRALPPAQRPTRICAGMTGFSESGERIRALIASAFALPGEAIALHSDIEITCLDLFAPDEGYVIYAGTGTIAAFIDAAGAFHRAGGRGAILDDAGGGFWIAIEALRQIWRHEDASPGCWRHSPMAREIFDRLGGSDWPQSREFVYHRERGEVGKLALAVAATADRDPVALDILQRAGLELARLGEVMFARFGRRPFALAGRVARLHPIIERSMRAALPPDCELVVRVSEAHIAAARIAAAHLAARAAPLT
ncbi:MAG: BadF/BadG/BcrA/BcrD ATPase family protein [Betaproteobacteria bacterium]